MAMAAAKAEDFHESIAYKITLIEFGVLFVVVIIILLMFLFCVLWALFRLSRPIFKILKRHFGPTSRNIKFVDISSPPSASKTSFLTSLPPPSASRLTRCPRCPFHPQVTSFPCKHGWRPESKALRVVGPHAQSTQSLLTSQDVPGEIVVAKSYSDPVN